MLFNVRSKINLDRIGTKMLWANILILSVLTLIVVGSGVNFYWTKVSLAKTKDVFLPQINLANTIKETVLKQRVLVEGYINHPSIEMKNEYRDLDRQFEDAYQNIKTLPIGSQEPELIEQVKYEHDNFTMIANNVFSYSDKKSQLVQTLLENYKTSVARVVKSSDELAGRYAGELEKSFEGTSSSLSVALAIMIALTLLTVIGAMGLTFILTRRITNPLKDMIEASQEIARGDLRQRVILDDRGELGLLASSFNSMVDNLSYLIQEVVAASKYIIKVSEDFRQHASDSALASNTVDSVLRAVVDGSATQSRTVTSVLNSANQVAVAIHEIDEVIQGVNRRNSLTTDLAQEGKKSVEEGFHQMSLISQAMAYLAETVGELTNHLSDISHIIDLMENFTEQTNMLALNAAIEAARVGEQGKGFAVVANEVRKLADESAKSLEQIRDVIDKITEKSIDTAKTMLESKTVVDSGSQAMQNVSSSLNEIIGFVTGSVAQFEALVGASSEISTNSRLIVQDIEELEDTAKETVAHANTLGMVINHQAQATIEAAASLDEIATALGQSTGKFALANILEGEKR